MPCALEMGSHDEPIQPLVLLRGMEARARYIGRVVATKLYWILAYSLVSFRTNLCVCYCMPSAQ